MACGLARLILWKLVKSQIRYTIYIFYYTAKLTTGVITWIVNRVMVLQLCLHPQMSAPLLREVRVRKVRVSVTPLKGNRGAVSENRCPRTK